MRRWLSMSQPWGMRWLRGCVWDMRRGTKTGNLAWGRRSISTTGPCGRGATRVSLWRVASSGARGMRWVCGGTTAWWRHLRLHVWWNGGGRLRCDHWACRRL